MCLPDSPAVPDVAQGFRPRGRQREAALPNQPLLGRARRQGAGGGAGMAAAAMASQGERAVLVSLAGERYRPLPVHDSTPVPPKALSLWSGSGGEPGDGGKAVPCARVRAERFAGAARART